MKYNRAAMKREVKQAMGQTRPHPMLATLLYLALVAIIAGIVVVAAVWLFSLIVNALSPGIFEQIGTLFQDLSDAMIEGMLNYGESYLDHVMDSHSKTIAQLLSQIGILFLIANLLSLVAGILITIWSGLMSTGYAGYCLNMSRGAKPGLGRLFSGFPRAGAVIPACILVAIFKFLWGLLFFLVYGTVIGGLSAAAAFVPSLTPVFVLLMMLAVVGYIITIVFVLFRYAMVPYAIVDNQKLPAMDAIRASKALMKGRKGRYFVLQLSFIGWHLLKGLVVVLGAAITAGIVFATGTVAAYAGHFEEIQSYGYETLLLLVQNGYYDLTWLTEMLNQIAIYALISSLLCTLVIFVLNLWLIPYRIGSQARFYIHAAGSQPGANVQPGTNAQLGTSVQPGPYGGRPGPYGGQPSPSYGSQPGPVSQPGAYGGQPGPSYSNQPNPYGGQPGPIGQPGPYPYSGNPYGYTPPSQSPFTSYPQGSQPSQYGSASIYPQQGVPQAPQAPSLSVTEPLLVAPAAPPVSEAHVTPEPPVILEAPVIPEAPIILEAPVVSEAPVISEAPVVPEIPVIPDPPVTPETTLLPETPVIPEPFVPTRLADPLNDIPLEEPYTEPEAPNGNTPQQPNDPNDPPY